MDQHVGEQLLAEVRQDLAEPPPGAMDRMRYTVQHRTPHLPAARAGSSGSRRIRRPVVVGGVAAGVALAVAAGVVVADGQRTTGTPSQGGAATTAGPKPGGSTGQRPARPADTPQLLLARIALAAKRTGQPIRDDQFIYTESVSDATLRVLNPDGRWVTKRFPDAPGKHWASVDGTRPGWSVSIDKLGQVYSAATPAYPPTAIGLRLPTYKYLTTLPTDPDALLALIRRSVQRTAGSKPNAVPDRDQTAFAIIGELLAQAVLPPNLAAALYQVAAKIPGVRIVSSTVDAAGREGIGISRRMSDAAARPAPGEVGAEVVNYVEWIFDRNDYRMLGERLNTAHSSNSIAITRAAVVDHPRQLPN